MSLYGYSDPHFLETVVQSIPTPFYVIEANTYRIVAANSAHMDSRDAIGMTCHEVSHKSASPCAGKDHICPLRLMRTTGKEVVVEHIHSGPHGSVRYIELHGYPVFSVTGELTHMIEFSLDITERRQATIALHEKNEELAQAYLELKESQHQLLQKEKLAGIGQLAAGVAHEINNPVGFVTSNMGTLKKYFDRLIGFMADQEKHLPPDKLQELEALKTRLKIPFVCSDIKELIEESQNGLERIAKIVRGLKNFSRADTDKAEPADINVCLEETLGLIWNELKYKATVERQFGNLPKTRCMPMQLSQVFMNLLVNAAHAIEEKGTITIKTWSDDTTIYVSIADTGSGIAPELLEKVFAPFFTTKEAGKGTGLGLSIVTDIIVKNHKGDIKVESEVDKGTTFTVKIPVVAEA